MDVVELAARIQAMPDDALDRLVVERRAPAQLGSTFDLAEHLLSDASIAQALRWRSAGELVALAAGASTPRLDALLLGADGVALPLVRSLAAAAERALRCCLSAHAAGAVGHEHLVAAPPGAPDP